MIFTQDEVLQLEDIIAKYICIVISNPESIHIMNPQYSKIKLQASPIKISEDYYSKILKIFRKNRAVSARFINELSNIMISYMNNSINPQGAKNLEEILNSCLKEESAHLPEYIQSKWQANWVDYALSVLSLQQDTTLISLVIRKAKEFNILEYVLMPIFERLNIRNKDNTVIICKYIIYISSISRQLNMKKTSTF